MLPIVSLEYRIEERMRRRETGKEHTVDIVKLQQHETKHVDETV